MHDMVTQPTQQPQCGRVHTQQHTCGHVHTQHGQTRTATCGSCEHIHTCMLQVMDCTHALLLAAKELKVAVFIIGHVTKEGDVAGPNTLSHLVDTVLYLEGEQSQQLRILRAAKNRHGRVGKAGGWYGRGWLCRHKERWGFATVVRDIRVH